MSQIRCNGCRVFFDGKLADCPDCDHPRPGSNVHLRASQLDDHLMGLKANAEREKAWEHGYRG